jgi:hypothetical protein
MYHFDRANAAQNYNNRPIGGGDRRARNIFLSNGVDFNEVV